MNADAFRMLYDYHISENHKLWDDCVIQLSQEQFTRHIDYSIGSVRNQIVHLMNVDEVWFSQLRGAEPLDIEDASVVDRDVIRQHWDGVEGRMREYLATLRDDMLLQKPWSDGEDKDLVLWQVLLHVANHGTDHRAQLLRLLNDLGAKTGPQDFVFYCYDHV